MTISYLLRLGCLSFSVFLLTHFLLELVVMSIAGWLTRRVETLKPRVAERALFALRILPTAVSVLFVVGLCIPSYIVHEQQVAGEEVGVFSVLLAAIGLVLCLLALRRGLLAVVNSNQYQHKCGLTGTQHNVGSDGLAVCVIETEQPVLALAGMVRPRLIASSGFMRALPQDQLEAALRHERAHWVARDNWKRLLMLLTPTVLRYSRHFVELEKSWSRYAERAADDFAVAGDADRAVALAGALVSAARMGSTARPAMLSCSLLDNHLEFAARVDRLLIPQHQQEMSALSIRLLVSATTAYTSLVTAIIIWYSTALSVVYQLLEEFLH